MPSVGRTTAFLLAFTFVCSASIFSIYSPEPERGLEFRIADSFIRGIYLSMIPLTILSAVQQSRIFLLSYLCYSLLSFLALFTLYASYGWERNGIDEVLAATFVDYQYVLLVSLPVCGATIFATWLTRKLWPGFS